MPPSQQPPHPLPRSASSSRIARRLLTSRLAIDCSPNEAITFQHTVLCQTSLPYRNPGETVRTWERRNGHTLIKLQAGEAADPQTAAMTPLGLPYGPKPRLILAYLNREALRTGSPVIPVERSLSAFIQRLGLHAHGRNLLLVNDQLARLAAARISLGVFCNKTQAVTIHTQIVSAFDLWSTSKSPRLRWPSHVELSREYFDSLTHHSVPLDERAVAALSHSAMGLDLYAWLAQRLHRIEPGNPQLVPWSAVKHQFGWHYRELFKFRQVFLQTLKMVTSQYRGARIEVDRTGLHLHHSPPPIQGRIALVVPELPCFEHLARKA